MPAASHLLIPYALSPAPGCTQILPTLELPMLQGLLQRLAPAPGTAFAGTTQSLSLSMPHERALAQALGLPSADGRIPWAAWRRVEQGQAPDAQAWAFVSPCLWHIGADHVTLSDHAALGLDEAASRALLDILAPWFAEDGITLHYEQPTRWLAQGALFADLATATFERVIGRDVRHWLPPLASADAARRLQRLHSEVQMLLYTHPFNAAREAQGLPAVNAFWVHGAGALPADWPTPQATAAATTLAVAEDLRAPALREDWPAWAAAWQRLDAGPLAALHAQLQRGAAVQLTLCGENGALHFGPAQRNLLQRLQSVFRPLRLSDLHNAL
ncbi:MAG: phosphoglycerate mutase [Burkholderiaceae bacterium]|nr:phosphoglycerate mutase [Burkholderiaceae bacterium]